MSDGAWKPEPEGHDRTGWRIRSPLHPRALSAGAPFGMTYDEARRVADWLNGPDGIGCVPGSARLSAQLLDIARPGHTAAMHRRTEILKRDNKQLHREARAREAADLAGLEAARATLAELAGPPEPVPTHGEEAERFRCAKTACTLSGTACGRRWADIDAKASRVRAGVCETTAFQAKLNKCHKCDAGRARADALGMERGKPERMSAIAAGPDHRNFPPMGAP